MRQNKLLYIAAHGLGDLIMSLPTLHLLQKEGYALSLLVKGEKEKAFLASVDILENVEIICASQFRTKNVIGNFLRLLVFFRPFKFNVILPQVNSNFYLFFLLSLYVNFFHAFKASYVLGKLYFNDRPDGGDHKVITNAKIAGQILRIIDIERKIEKFPSNKKLDYSRLKVAISPGSASEYHKRWPATSFARLIELIGAEFPEVEINLYGSPDEIQLCEQIQAESIFHCGVISAKTFDDFFECLKNSDICIANCNGASHMAALVGTPVLGLYGPTNFNRTGPYSQSSDYISLRLPCSPCYSRTMPNGCGAPICLTDLSPTDVFLKLKSMLSNAPK